MAISLLYNWYNPNFAKFKRFEKSFMDLNVFFKLTGKNGLTKIRKTGDFLDNIKKINKISLEYTFENLRVKDKGMALKKVIGLQNFISSLNDRINTKNKRFSEKTLNAIKIFLNVVSFGCLFPSYRLIEKIKGDIFKNIIYKDFLSHEDWKVEHPKHRFKIKTINGQRKISFKKREEAFLKEALSGQIIADQNKKEEIVNEVYSIFYEMLNKMLIESIDQKRVAEAWRGQSSWNNYVDAINKMYYCLLKNLKTIDSTSTGKKLRWAFFEALDDLGKIYQFQEDSFHYVVQY